MKNDLTAWLQGGALQNSDPAHTLQAVNDRTAALGLCLTQGEALALAQGRTAALIQTGRLEIGPGVLPALADAFADSPYTAPRHWAADLLR